MLALSTDPVLGSAGRTALTEFEVQLAHLGPATLMEAGPRVLHEAAELARREDVEALTLEVEPVSPAFEDLAAQTGLEATREMLRLERSLPLEAGPADDDSSLSVRAFDPERDREEWLLVNNRAFAWHPDQGGWTLADLEERTVEPWFDPAGFLLHDLDGRLAGFCWTKIHTDVEPPIGEIYVIGVDPAFQGRGLGRALVLAGLDHLARRGLRDAMLYVEADNDTALTLYRNLGFSTVARHLWWNVPLRDPEP